MNRISNNSPLYVLAGLFVPITIYAVSTHITSNHTQINYEWLNAARIANAFITIFYFIYLIKIEKILYRKSQKENNLKTQNTRVTTFIIGIAVIQTFSINTLIFQLFKLATPTDVLIYSAISIAGILFWTWRYSNIIIPMMSEQYDESKSFIIESNSNNNLSKVNFTNTYTVILKVLGLIFLLFLIIQINSFFKSLNDPDVNAKIKVLSLAFIFFDTFGCFITVYLRKIKSIYALYATKIISYLLIFWIPLGTAAFIYWYVKIRKIEEIE